MKKVLLGIFFAAIGYTAYGQQPVNPAGYLGPQPVNALERQALNSSTAKFKIPERSNWYNYIDLSTNFVSAYKGYYNFLYPDSTAKADYIDPNTSAIKSYYVGTHSVGQSFDPKSEYFDDTLKLSPFTRYHWDSIALYYQYRRYKSTDDTLIFQFYVNDKTRTNAAANTGLVTSQLSWTSPTGGTLADPTAIVQFDKTRNLGLKPVKEYTYVLQEKDTNTSKVGIIQLPTDIDVSANGFVAFTVTYRPGYKNAMGDTIGDWRSSAPFPKNPLNIFKFFEYQEANGTTTQPYQKTVGDHSYNNEETLIKSVRYNLSTAGSWAGRYIPGDAWLGYNGQLLSAFHITTQNVGIHYDKQLSGYGAGNVYPNPANGEARMQFSIGKAEHVTITLNNIMGQKIGTIADGNYGAGTQTVSFNTDNLTPGIYFYTIQAGSFTQSVKFTVAR